MDLIKQRMQLGFYDSMSTGVRTVLQTEGFRALYVSLPTTLLMNIPYASVMVSTNESLKKFFNPEGRFDISTFMLANEGSNRSYPHIEVPEGHHTLSHHGKKPANLEGIRRINRWHAERFAEFVARLAETDDEGADLLTQSTR